MGDRLTATGMDRKLGLCPFGEGRAGCYVSQCSLGQSPSTCQIPYVSSNHLAITPRSQATQPPTLSGTGNEYPQSAVMLYGWGAKAGMVHSTYR